MKAVTYNPMEHQHFNRIKKVIANPGNEDRHTKHIFKMIQNFYKMFDNKVLYDRLLISLNEQVK